MRACIDLRFCCQRGQPWYKIKCLQKKRLQLLHDWFGTPRSRPHNAREILKRGPNFTLKLFGRKTFLKRSFIETDDMAITWCDFPARGLLKHKSKLAGACCIFKFLWRSVDEMASVSFLWGTNIAAVKTKTLFN